MGKFKTVEEANKALEKVKADKKPLTSEKRSIIFKTPEKSEAKIKDKAILKKLAEINAKLEPLNKKQAEIEEEISVLKPKGPRVGVETGKYAYPEGMSSADKKKFRAAARRGSTYVPGEEKKADKKKADVKEEAKATVDTKKKIGKPAEKKEPEKPALKKLPVKKKED